MAIQNNFPNLTPTLLLDFANAGKLDPRVTFSRASTATFFNSLGVLSTAASGAARFDYNPTTLAPLGLLIEEQRTNSIRNNTMQGAVAGTPGTAPTNWSSFVGANLTFEIIGTGTESGITYIDLRIYGTANATNVVPAFEGDTQVVASNGQTWTSSLYFKIISQPAPFNSYTNRIRINNSGGTQIAQIDTGFSPTTTLTRYVNTGTIASATAAFVNQSVRLGLTSGQAYDVTFRIGLPQLEQGAFATSVIPTTTTALTRNADAASMTGTNFSSWYSASEGTLFVEYTGNMPTTLSGNRAIASISDGTYNNNIFFYKANAGASQLFDVISGGATQASLSSAYAANTGYKAAGAYLLNNVNASVNGNIGTTDTSATIPSGVNKLEFRDPTGASGGQPSIVIRRFAFYPQRLANAQLQALTA